MWVNTSAGKDNLLEKTTTKFFLVGILFLLFLYNFEVKLDFMYFPKEVFDIIYEYLLYGCFSLSFELSGKVLQVTLALLFFSFILCILTRISLSGSTKKSFKRNKPIERRCCHTINIQNTSQQQLTFPLWYIEKWK